MGLCPACPDGGERGRVVGAGQILITCPGSQGTLCPCSLLMIRVGRSWNPLLLPPGPRSSSLMTSWVPGSLASCCLFLAVVLGRCNRQGPITKSPSEGETLPYPSLTVFFSMRRIDAFVILAGLWSQWNKFSD